jgi:putative toxin-antitoxin system antitoxin component (TIGR02293 family)
MVPLEWVRFECAFHAGNAALASTTVARSLGQHVALDMGDGDVVEFRISDSAQSRFASAVSDVYKGAPKEFLSAIYRLEALNQMLHREESNVWLLPATGLELKPQLHPAMFMIAATLPMTRYRQFRRSSFFREVAKIARESERAKRLLHVVERAKGVFVSSDAARDWLSAPNILLRGCTPLRLLETEDGAENVLDALGRIEHGAFG